MSYGHESLLRARISHLPSACHTAELAEGNIAGKDFYRSILWIPGRGWDNVDNGWQSWK